MTWLPISGTLPQFTTDGEQANGYVLKFYEIGTTTPLTVSSSNTGTPTTTDFLLDTEGYTTLSAVRVIPHVQTGYKLICYLNQTDADANDTGSAVWTIYSITLASTQGSVTGVDNIIELAAVNTTFFQTCILKGTNTVDDGGQGTFYFDINSTATPNGTTVIAPDAGTGRWLILPLGDDSVGTDQILDDAVTTDKILDDAVTYEKVDYSPVTRYFYTANGTHTPQTGITRIEFEVIGAGGGGGGTNLAVANTFGGGGGGGGYVFSSTDTIAASYTVTVGSGGTGGAAGLNNGSSGGNSIVTDGASYTLTSTGGSGGVAGTNGNTGANGAYGVGTGGDILANGSTSVSASAGGTSVFNGEVLLVDDSDGEDAITVGCGGNGGRNAAGGGTNFAGGDGFDGWIKVTEYF